MDPGAMIYAALLNSLTAYLGKVNPQLTASTLAEKVRLLNSAGVKCRLDGAVLTVTDADVKSRGAFYDTILSYTSVFEEKYGVNEMWGPLKSVTVRVLQNSREDVRELGLEIPVAKYRIEYTLLDTLFGYQASDFRKRHWINDSVLITNHNLIVPRDGNMEVIPLQAIATIGREIYVGYSAEAAKGIIRAIDYLIKASGMSCAVILAKGELMNDFMKTTSIIRSEYRRLSQGEAKVLLALYNETPVDQLAGKCGLSQQDAEKAFRRLLELRYTDNKGHLTSYGINASMELMQTKR